eukprot:6456915-Amphidinium_carterae.1
MISVEWDEPLVTLLEGLRLDATLSSNQSLKGVLGRNIAHVLGTGVSVAFSFRTNRFKTVRFHNVTHQISTHRKFMQMT